MPLPSVHPCGEEPLETHEETSPGDVLEAPRGAATARKCGRRTPLGRRAEALHRAAGVQRERREDRSSSLEARCFSELANVKTVYVT